MIRVEKSSHVHRMSADSPPCTAVDPGCRLIVEAWDALEGRAREYFENSTPPSVRIPNANPATGPIFVNGSRPGDALEVFVHDIRVTGAGYITVRLDRISHSGAEGSTYTEIPI